jgi:hypothetical protein
MRSHIRRPRPPTTDASAPATSRSARIAARFQSLIDWLRAGYPDEAPRHGHSPLIALNGPVSLSERQTQQIAGGLTAEADPVDVQVEITKTTDRLPTASQVDRVRRALQERTD